MRVAPFRGGPVSLVRRRFQSTARAPVAQRVCVCELCLPQRFSAGDEPSEPKLEQLGGLSRQLRRQESRKRKSPSCRYGRTGAYRPASQAAPSGRSGKNLILNLFTSVDAWALRLMRFLFVGILIICLLCCTCSTGFSQHTLATQSQNLI